MAKLCANGRTELARMQGDSGMKIALMSDGKVLWNLTGSGWTVKGKIKDGISTDRWVELYQARGFVRISR